MKVLLIGFGSIGKRHYEILNGLAEVQNVDLVSQQNLPGIQSYVNLSDIEDLNVYDYFIIASETYRHYEDLKYICSRVEEKSILVEKPLYNTKKEELKCTNKVFVAYNLRFHPVMEKLKELLSGKKVYFANIICGQYLPTWRPEQDYRKSYSADIGRGGGVLRDLSHELDYVNWLFGDIDMLDFISTRISDLQIASDDIFTAIGLTKKKTIINVSMDYISKVPMRRMVVHTDSSTIEADFMKNSIVEFDINSKADVVKLEEIDRNYTYRKMHQSILSNRQTKVCSFDEGKRIIELIDDITYKEI